MGTITIEQIDLIMERANVTYGEAKAALEQTSGDVVEALLLLEKDQKLKAKTISNQSQAKSEKITSFIEKLNATSFIMRKKTHTFVDIPLSVAIILVICTFHISIVGLLLSLLFGIKIEFKGENEVAEKINSTIDSINK
ncbi:DUF4342 domain-containing protein [Cellulosilyticum sp. I15G10I2]|uniref:DUF4342 domain-containing protein n=1 Tax=Cellulosilyticum sp. I15G10I2 TaxID=1892843 RepID=UPI00085BF820|nr:DUF4342 domain-containing protein [Cellulosilyticum sp. I15G10I2]